MMAGVHAQRGTHRYVRLDAGGSGCVARGSFGVVYLAMGMATGSAVAVKRQRLPSDEASRELAMYCLLRRHPHKHVLCLLDQFVQSMASGTDEGTTVSAHYLFFIFPFMPETAWALWRSAAGQAGLLEQRRIASLLDGASRGVSHLHGLDVVHGGLSLKNVILDPHGDACVCDMGAVCCVRKRGLCSCHEVRTTGCVRAPESWFGAPMRAAADVWALGVMALALFSGQIPWLRAGEMDEPDTMTMMSRVADVIGLPVAPCPGDLELPGWDAFVDRRKLAAAPHHGVRPGCGSHARQPRSAPV